MLQTMIIGNLGADAQFKNDNGHEFTTFRVGHNDTWTDKNGQKQTRTQWVDIVMQGKPNVLPYLKKGTTIFAIGNTTTRVYSSEKDRCMKAGITINAHRVELLAGNSDAVPSRLYDKVGQMHVVQKFFHTDIPSTTLMTPNGNQFNVDENGWVFPVVSPNNQANATQQPTDEDNIDRSADDAPAFDGPENIPENNPTNDAK